MNSDRVYWVFKNTPIRSAVIYQIKMDGESLFSQFYCFGQRNVIECFHSNLRPVSPGSSFVMSQIFFYKRKIILEIFSLELFSFLITTHRRDNSAIPNRAGGQVFITTDFTTSRMWCNVAIYQQRVRSIRCVYWFVRDWREAVGRN